MKTPKISIGFPLLVKELTEAAAQRRTYLVRVSYAMLLFLAIVLFFWSGQLTTTSNPFSLLGAGKRMFDNIVELQFYGIYLFLPAMTCTALTAEKERDSLALLLLTRLGPWTILVEKLMSRLIPMFTFMLLSLPLMAFAYSFGGMQSYQIWGAIWFLSLTSLQVAALCLMCSAYCRTTVGAYLSANLLGLFLFFLAPGVAGVIFRSSRWPATFSGMDVYTITVDRVGTALAWGDLFQWSIPLMFSTIIFFCLSRFFLLRRAFAQPRHLLRKIFRGLDNVFWKINSHSGGVVLVGENATLPEDKPVQWREIAKKNLSQFRYLVRIFLVLEFPVGLVCIVALTSRGVRASTQLREVSPILFLLWIISALIVTVQASSLISSERSRQTLDVLLATPMSGREIILQKMHGLRRVMWVLGACFLTIFLSETWWYGSAGITPAATTTAATAVGFPPSYGTTFREPFLYYYSGARYFVASMLSVLIYFPLIAWLALWIGLKTKTQTRAILGSLALLVAWCGLTFACGRSDFVASLPVVGTGYFDLSSPLGMIYRNEYNDFGTSQGVSAGIVRGNWFRWLVVAGNFACYGLLLYLIRARCLRDADRYLGRRQDHAPSARPAAVRNAELQDVQPVAAG